MCRRKPTCTGVGDLVPGVSDLVSCVGLQGPTRGAEPAHLHSVADGEELVRAEAVAELLGMQQPCDPPPEVDEHAIVVHGRHPARDDVPHLHARERQAGVHDCSLTSDGRGSLRDHTSRGSLTWWSLTTSSPTTQQLKWWTTVGGGMDLALLTVAGFRTQG